MFNRFDRFNMRKVIRNLFILTFISFTAGTVVLFATGGGILIAKGNVLNSSNYVKEESIKGVDEISIESTSAQIIVVTEKRENLKAELSGKSSSHDIGLHTSLSGNNLNIEVESKTTIGISFSSQDLKLYIYIPEDYSKSIAVKSSSGKIEIGKMKLKNLSCRVISGSAEIEDITAEKFDYSNTSGSLKADKLYTKQSVLKSTSGSIKIDDFSGNLICTQISGSTNIDYKSFDNDVQLESISGSIKLNLPSNSEFALDARTTSGSINSEFPVTVEGEHESKKLIGYVKDKDNKIAIKTTSGSIKIEN